MNVDEFREDLINSIKAQSREECVYPEDIFIDYCKDILINDFSLLSDLIQTYYEYKATNNLFKSMRVDASYLEKSVNTLHLLYCDYHEESCENINNDFINQKANLLTNFFINVTKGYFSKSAESDPVTQCAFEIRKNFEYIKKLHLIIISTNKKSLRLKTTINTKPIILSNKEYLVDLTLLDINGIYETKLSGFKRDDIIINTNDYGLDGIPCLKANVESKEYDSYLAVVPGTFLSEIYQKYSARLLESNVRSFLNTRGEINKGILNTILSDKTKFFAYNNGIATIADSIVTEKNEQGLVIKSFKNLQIINGGQTTASLALAVIKNNADLSGIYVQMKLSIIKSEIERPELIRLISKFANKQNKVTDADLNSNHPFYGRIENYSRKIKTPIIPNSTIQTIWFFERVRGQYDQGKMKLLTKKERDIYEKLNPKNQKFTKTDLAKFINSSLMKPYDVSWGAEVNMKKFQASMEKEWEKDNSKFNEYYYKELIAKAIMFKGIEKIINSQDWYMNNKGYRAQLVTYTFSRFIYEIKKTNKVLNYKKIWETQKFPEIFTGDIEKIAKICFDVFNDKNRAHNNITEYTKRQICWDTLIGVKYDLSSDAISSLISKEDNEAESRQAIKDQKFDNEVLNETIIFNLGVDYWRKVQQIGIQLNELNQHEIDLCDYAIKYIKRIYDNLSKKQTKELIEIKNRMDSYIEK